MSTVLNTIAKLNVKTAFSATSYARGRTYFQEHRVMDLHIQHPSSKESIVTSSVKGSTSYAVYISLYDKGHGIEIRSKCTCPLKSDCKHVVASLLQAFDQISTALAPPKQQTLSAIKEDPAVIKWLSQLQQVMTTKVASSEPMDQSMGLYYVLKPSHSASSMSVVVQPLLVRHLKAGGFGASKEYSSTTHSQRKHLYPIDKELLIKLDIVNKSTNDSYYAREYNLGGELGDKLLPEIINTGRCVWHSIDNKPLTLTEPKAAIPVWELDEQGAQTFRLKMDGPPYLLFFIENGWYLNRVTSEIGLLDTGLDPKIVQVLLSAPKIPPAQTEAVFNFLNNQATIGPRITPPKQFKPTPPQKIKPVPCLRLFQADFQINQYYSSTTWTKSLAEFSFDYQGTQTSWNNKNETIHLVEGEQLKTIVRDKAIESKALQTLINYKLVVLHQFSELLKANEAHANAFVIDYSYPDPLIFTTTILPQLRAAGWRIEFDEHYPYQIIDDAIDDWYSSIEEEASGYDWFGLELGIMVKGEKINLLPILQTLLKQLQQREAIDEAKPVYAKLPNGHYIQLPADRVKTILNVLVELYDGESLTDDQRLRLSNLQAARLIELEAAFGAAQLRWFGGDRLRQLGRKLVDFKGIQPADVPAQFLGQLRPYQLDGLSWLQFLREYEFGGILADDMGLGKTVQALAHLMLEKSSGRMNKPCLVIAPTSLMFNWQMEAKRFAPDLRVLLLHGANRKEHFDHLSNYDLVLTTYPLIVRDKTILLEQDFYILILDEAQFIKNAKSQVAQIAIQIKAAHRICLTGTPMENHLGELWSLFHFMMPGLLGEQKAFTRLFRTPIEKHANQERREHLNRRIAPFLLRRTKDKVVQELPEKVEMIRHVELAGHQRDLYETIRVTMQEKVRKEIAKLGFSRSHIIMLDALLKLRQVCCDPRLLKVTAAKKKTAKSAKLDLLMSLIPELLEEGRRILLFSQFTEMLGLIEDELTKVSIPYVKLTGQTKDRATPVQQFQKGDVPLFLISLKAGGTGLNLTAADTVIHYDPWWNPAVENQATDRAHRIGQEKTVFVYKLVVKGTVEDKILEMQERKHALMEGLFSGKTTNKLALTEHDLQGLFEPLEEE